ncbi:MAG: hypothetical protein IJW82_07040 [Clostridia bacterium]|nr:hypothetical protein [Clostridia bacterium]
MRRNKLNTFELCLIIFLGLVVAYTTYNFALPYLNNAWGNINNNQETTTEESTTKEEEDTFEITIKVSCSETSVITLTDSDGNEIECKSSSKNESIYNVEKETTYTIKVIASGYVTHTQEIEPTENTTYSINLVEGSEI